MLFRPIQGATAQTITIGGDLNMSAAGTGASANTGLAGKGQGGQATLSLSGGKHGLTVANAFLSAAGALRAINPHKQSTHSRLRNEKE